LSAESQSPTPAPGARPKPRFRDYRFVVTYWLVFIGIIGGMAALNELYPALVEVHFSEWTAAASGFVMRLLGWGGRVEGISIINPYCHFYIIGECTAYYLIAIYLAATVAYPAPWLRRLVGIVVGIPVVLVVNVLRLVTLCYMKRMYPLLFESAHLLFWQALMIFFTILVWIVWVSTFAHPRES
jgi:exosortase/archaeosortase family protein